MIDKNCDNCKFGNYDADDWPCDECVCFSNWQSDEYKDCEDCKFESVNLEDQPCYDCMSGVNHWTSKDTPTNDPVNHPNHYCRGGIECIDTMEAAFGKQTVADFCICNAFKYIFRCKNKNGLEDVKKARWYLDKYLKLYDENDVRRTTMKYKIGDHVIIERSNVDWLGKFAGKSGTILEVDPVLEGWYKVFPDEWGEIVAWQGVWSKVKCLVDNVDNVNSKYLNCKFMLATVPYDAREFLTKGKIYTMVDGRFEADTGNKWPFDDPIENEADLIAYFNGCRDKEPAFSTSSAQVIIIKED